MQLSMHHVYVHMVKVLHELIEMKKQRSLLTHVTEVSGGGKCLFCLQIVCLLFRKCHVNGWCLRSEISMRRSLHQTCWQQSIQRSIRTNNFDLLLIDNFHFVCFEFFSRPYERKVNICWLLNGAINIFQVLLGTSKLFKEQNKSKCFQRTNKSIKKILLIFFYLYAYMLENFVSTFFFIYFLFFSCLSSSSFVILFSVCARMLKLLFLSLFLSLSLFFISQGATMCEMS